MANGTTKNASTWDDYYNCVKKKLKTNKKDKNKKKGQVGVAPGTMFLAGSTPECYALKHKCHHHVKIIWAGCV